MNPPSLKPCPACENPLSSAARVCPKCGHLVPREPMHPGTRNFLIVLAFLVVAALWSYAVHEGNEELRKMQRDHAQKMQDMSYGTYR